MNNQPILDTLEKLTVLARDVDDDLMHARCTAAAETLLYYTTHKDPGSSGEDFDTELTDLLADLMHLTDACGLPPGTFAACLERARMHYDEESAAERSNHCEE